MLDKDEERRKYKSTLQPMGVYSVSNSVNGKVLVGSSLNTGSIFNRISFQLKNGSYPNEELQKDYKLQRDADFSFKVLDFLKPVDDPLYNYTEDLRVLEELWLEKLQPYGATGYNTRKVSKV